VPGVIELELRNDVYRRPLATAWTGSACAKGGAAPTSAPAAGDVTVALARIVGRDGRVYAVDSDPARRDEVAAAAAEAAQGQVVALTQAGEELTLPEPIDLAFCRFVLLHVHSPVAVLQADARCGSPGGWVVAQEPVTSAGRIGGQADPCRCPTPATPTSAPFYPLWSARPAWTSSTRGPRPRPGPAPVRWPTISKP
jgi:SAM-dependent methyltransferase